MLKFFRNIRRNLLAERKMNNYLLYAVGEVILVMIGILLALQVNNWNNNRINRQLEKKILIQLHSEFQINKKNFELVTSARIRNMKSCNKIIEMFPIELDKTDIDSLSYYLKNTGNRTTFNPSNGAINALINSSSFDIITNEKLRSALVQWKDLVADYLEDEAIADYHLVNYWDPYMNKRIPHRLHDIPKIETIYDKRVDLTFLTTIEFENLVIRRRNNLQRIANPREEVTELELVSRAIDTILELSKD